MDAAQDYDRLLREFAQVKTSSERQDSKEYQEQLTKCLAHGLNFKTFVQTKSNLFSTNETLDDLSTKALRFLSLDYYLAQMMVRKQVVTDSAPQRNAVRLKFLQKTVQLLIQFMVSLQDYKLLPPTISKKIDGFESVYEPRLDELYQGSNDDTKDATLKRQQKIEIHKANKELEVNIHSLEERLRTQRHDNFEEDQEDYSGQDDEELLRELYLAQLRQLSLEAWNQLEQILMEIELLKNFTQQVPYEDQQQQKKTTQKEDPTGYTDKLESLNKPLLTKAGKVLRNFTLLGKRDELKSKVFGYGQYGPTMTVEEFLAKEFEENRVLQGGEEVQQELNEDDEEAADIATYKARAWDEFTEANPKGSGNTLNRG